jgi:hypothetical protein
MRSEVGAELNGAKLRGADELLEFPLPHPRQRGIWAEWICLSAGGGELLFFHILPA